MAKNYTFKKNTYSLSSEASQTIKLVDLASGVGAFIPKVNLSGKPIVINPKLDNVEVVFIHSKNNRYPIRKVLINEILQFETNEIKLNKIYRMKRGSFKIAIRGTTHLNVLYCSDSGREVQAEITELFEDNKDKKPREILKKLVNEGKDDEKRAHLVLGVQKSEYKVSIPIKYVKVVTILAFDEKEATTRARPEKWIIDEVSYIVNHYDIELDKKPWKIEHSDYLGVFHKRFKAKYQFNLIKGGQTYFHNSVFYCLYNGDYRLELFFLDYKTNKIKLVEKEFDLRNFDDLKFLTHNFIVL